MSTELTRELREIVADLVTLAPDVIADDTAFTTLEGWDSLHQLNLLLAIEERFGLELQPADLDELTTVQQAAAIVERHDS